MTMTTSKQTPSETSPDMALNEVTLIRRLSAPAELRELPSGDRAAVWRLVVRRRGKGRRLASSVDTIDCVSFQKALVNRSLRWEAGIWLRVDGELRRRF